MTSSHRTGRRALEILGVAVAYAASARFGLALDAVGGFATVVWAPSGIALAALLLLGRHAIIGIVGGAFVANAWNGAAAGVAAGIAVGNTLEAIAAAWLLRRTRGFDTALRTTRDVLVFLGLAAAAAPVVSATIGVTVLTIFGALSSGWWTTWRAWWVGDSIGILLVTPVVLTWRQGFRAPRAEAAEYVAVLVVTGLVAWIVFFGRTGVADAGFLHAYLLFPPLTWAAMRHHQRGTTAAILLAAAIAVVGTASGSGPFGAPRLHDNLYQLQTFSGIIAASFLLLAAAVEERTTAQQQLRRSLAAETDANRAKSDFLAVMSHELRTPLNAISGYSDLLDMDVYGTLTLRQRDALHRIQRNRAHLTQLVEDLLSFTRVEAGKLTLDVQSLRVAEAIARLQAHVELDVIQKQHDLRMSLGDPAVTVRADPDKLRQVLLNVVGNAIKYTPMGGRIDVDVVQRESTVLIRVADSGIGIPPEQIGRVFEPFFQVERGMTRRYPGAGLGLSIARDLARAMGGDVTLESRPGSGTTVYVTLLRDPAPVPHPA